MSGAEEQVQTHDDRQKRGEYLHTIAKETLSETRRRRRRRRTRLCICIQSTIPKTECSLLLLAKAPGFFC
jgi:hypothetical protein